MPRQTRKLPKNSMTLDGLTKWYAHLFDKLGWMVIAKAKGCSSKLTQYKKSIDHFLTTAKKVKSEYENHNRKHDIDIYVANMEALKRHVSAHF
jgi:hypothetical protein